MSPLDMVTPKQEGLKAMKNKQLMYEIGFLQQHGYKLGRTIGEGSYSKVRTALKIVGIDQCMKIACKMISKRKASNDFVAKFLPRELNVIRNLRHPNIIQVYDIFESPEHVYIFMNLCEKGDLLEYIKHKGPLPEYKAKGFFRQIVSAVLYLHNIDVSHRDLKCENIFITALESMILGDFGFARSCRDLSTHKQIRSETFCGSAAYAAPEILQGTPYDPKMYDMWSLGCILYIMLTGTMPFDDSVIRDMLRLQLLRQFETRRFKLKPAAQELIYCMLEPDITCRATISQIAQSPWLQDHYNHNFYPSIPIKYAAQR